MEIIRKKEHPLELSSAQVSRRSFLRWSGVLGASAAVVGLQACEGDTNIREGGIDLGSGDVGVLNYAFALEQLEAAFYTQVVNTPYSGITAAETAYMQDIRDHEIAHREFFRTALGSNKIQDLQVNFSAINFSSRDSVLATAKAFEDLGVSAYNGAGKLLSDANNLLIAGKIVSVEARHAALIRDLISLGTFADSTVIDANGLDVVRTPAQVLEIASAYLVSRLDASNLPTS